VGALDDPPFADLDRCGDAFAGDLIVQAQPVEQGARDVRVVAGVEM